MTRPLRFDQQPQAAQDAATQCKRPAGVRRVATKLVSQLLALGLPVESRTENPEEGLAFDILRSNADGPKVMNLTVS